MNVLRENLMCANEGWNRQGPHIPAWFKRKLRAIDPTLVLQYMPPAPPERSEDGVNCDIFPNGAWFICRRLPRSRMLLKRAAWCMTNPGCDRPSATRIALKMIRRARNASRAGAMRRMSQDLDRACANVTKAYDAEERAFWASRVVDTCVAHSLTRQALGNRVHMQGHGIPQEGLN